MTALVGLQSSSEKSVGHDICTLVAAVVIGSFFTAPWLGKLELENLRQIVLSAAPSNKV